MRLDNAHIIDAKTPKKTLKKQDGFTLIEVLVALTIFAVGLLAIAAMQTSAIRMNSTGNRITEISTVSIDRLENLMSVPYAQLVTGTDPTPPAGYTINWTVAPNALTLNTSTVMLTVAGKGKTLSLVFIRAKSL